MKRVLMALMCVGALASCGDNDPTVVGEWQSSGSQFSISSDGTMSETTEVGTELVGRWEVSGDRFILTLPRREYKEDIVELLEKQKAFPQEDILSQLPGVTEPALTVPAPKKPVTMLPEQRLVCAYILTENPNNLNLLLACPNGFNVEMQRPK